MRYYKLNMAGHGWSFSFLAICSTIFLLLNLSMAATFLQDLCFDDFSPKSRYESNLNHLISSIDDASLLHMFNTSSTGYSPDQVHGMFQCRGDISPEDCTQCVKSAADDIQLRCSYKKEVTLWFEECWLRYSNKPIIWTRDGSPNLYLSDAKYVSNPGVFRSKLNELMNALVKTAATSSTNMFARDEVMVTKSQTIYGLVQCSQDLNSSNCEHCLKLSVTQIHICCDRREGGQIPRLGCILRFDTHKFYDLPGNKKGLSRKVRASIISTIVVGLLILSGIIYYLLQRRKRLIQEGKDVEEISSVDSLKFTFRTIQCATNNFSRDSMIGEGGFGIVYKGRLLDGRDIAVKRLSRNSGQGAKEFKNEVLLVVKLQHRNLVKLLGFCLEGREKLLIYEFVPNASLDHFIFCSTKCTYLNWEKRYNIICGIARGLLYLHEDSRHRVIHRDLKAGNVLLDVHMNPKISDFGMARLVGVDQTQGSTGVIMGTYGYMAPEYAMHGQFSVKSDVFSFGVLVLEIVTGKKNKCSFKLEHVDDFLSHAWELWKRGKALDLLEPMLKEKYSLKEVLRCIYLGLLCVQEDATLRPTMSKVIHILSEESVIFSVPSTPAFFTSKNKFALGDSQSMGFSLGHSINQVSMTEFYPR